MTRRFLFPVTQLNRFHSPAHCQEPSASRLFVLALLFARKDVTMTDLLRQRTPDGCPGMGESRVKLCICGTPTYSYLGYNATAQRRIYEAETGLVHDCPRKKLATVLECCCGVMIRRYQDGYKLNMDWSEHRCGQTPETPAPKPATCAKPNVVPAPMNTKRHIIPME